LATPPSIAVETVVYTIVSMFDKGKYWIWEPSWMGW